MNDAPDLPLRDIHLPGSVSWWPPAPGWWLLAGLVVLLILLVVWWLRRRWRRQSAATTLALRELDRIETDFRSGVDAGDIVRRLSVLMRRLSISLFPRSEAAGLTGEAWLAFLDRTLQRPAFSAGPGRVLHEAPYRPSVSDEEVKPLLALCREWIETVRDRAP